MGDSPKKKVVVAKKPAEHPKYIDMIQAAIAALKERKGSSRQAISKYISANYKVGNQSDVHLRSALKRGVAAGNLKQVSGNGASGSFKLPPPPAKKPKAKKPAAPKKTVKKKAAPKKTPVKKAAKKTPVKKAAAAKKKPAAAKKSAAKKPAAKKPAAAAKKPAAKKAVKKTPKKKAAAKK